MELLRRYSNTTCHPKTAIRVLRKYGETDTPDARAPSRSLPQTHKARQGLDPISTAELVAAYEAGATTRQLMASYNLGKGAVLRLLRANGVQLRYQSMTPEQVETVIRLYARGLYSPRSANASTATPHLSSMSSFALVCHGETRSDGNGDPLLKQQLVRCERSKISLQRRTTQRSLPQAPFGMNVPDSR